MPTLTVTSITHSSGRSDVRLVLPFELRQRSRLLAMLDSGEEIGLTLPRGTVLRGGDRLQASDGRLVEVVAAPEQVSIIRSSDARELARAAYHLGNRHVAVQVTSSAIQYLSDHVLDDMLRGLGLAVESDVLPFEPEGGAYSQAHSHGHAHGHTHGDPHGHG
ncbi:MAG TPA: urease accessory protein UreE [Steroidobacteraceae bacterium]|nr:urease accessory protein UreE [Steroidobacteraceae bacterium]